MCSLQITIKYSITENVIVSFMFCNCIWLVSVEYYFTVGNEKSVVIM